MGGTANLLIPAPYTGMSSRAAHLKRKPPSSEPGTDYYMPIGTPLRSPTRCRIADIGGGIVPATGRFVTFDDGVRWMRALHLSQWLCREGDWLDAGEVFGLSGASGYGSEFFGARSPDDAGMIQRTGGPHVHMTAFRGRGYTFGALGTVDFHAMTGGAVAGGGLSPALPRRNRHMNLYRCTNIDGNGNAGVAVLNDAAPVRSLSKAGSNPLVILDKYSGSAAQIKKWEKVVGMTPIVVTRDEFEVAMSLVQQTRGGQ